jgi:D-apionolactonase
MPSEVLYDGKPEPPVPRVLLKAGPLTAQLEPDTGFLRYIRIGDHEILRGIYAALRDRNWNTVPPRLSRVKVESGPQSFQVTFTAHCLERDIDFIWQAAIRGDETGRITYEFDGESRSTFLRNRIGFCVLHPVAECAGRPCTVETPEGAVEKGSFPKTIAPSQPFRNIRAITHEPAPGVQAQVRFEGEIFEMEDQRNWTDASFKTYGPPLDRPFPVEVKRGEHVRQGVTLSLPGQPRKVLPVSQGRGAQLSIATTPVLSLPPLGLCLAGHGQGLTDREVERLKRLRLAHLRADLKFNDPSWPQTLAQATAQALQLGVRLHLALHLTDGASEELAALREALAALQPQIGLWLVFQVGAKITGESWLQLARERLTGFGTNVLFAAGTNGHFAELNRQRPAPDSTALPCYSITPQVHAFDNASLVESLAAQPMTVESAMRFAPRAVVVSPVTLKPRFNAYATSELPPAPPGEWPATVDVRQMSLFGAGWTAGSLSRLATTGGLHSLTYYETTGCLGIMETEEGSPWPERFPSHPGTVFPVYHVFADLAGFPRLYPTHSSHPLETEGITVVDDKNRRRILVANLLGETREIKIKTGTCRAQVRYLDETTAEQATRSPEEFQASPGEPMESAAGKIGLTLKPYAVATVDVIA